MFSFSFPSSVFVLPPPLMTSANISILGDGLNGGRATPPLILFDQHRPNLFNPPIQCVMHLWGRSEPNGDRRDQSNVRHMPSSPKGLAASPAADPARG